MKTEINLDWHTVFMLLMPLIAFLFIWLISWGFGDKRCLIMLKRGLLYGLITLLVLLLIAIHSGSNNLQTYITYLKVLGIGILFGCCSGLVELLWILYKENQTNPKT